MIGSPDALKLAEEMKCDEHIRKIALNVIEFAGEPTEAEILARCRAVFDCMLYHAIGSVEDADFGNYEVTIETTEE